MSRHDYANGRDVLPSEVLAIVQRHYNGLVWIPSPASASDRHDQIHQMRANGMTILNIAERVGLSERRVRQILKG